jgi:uncharacterized protein YaeQ
VALTATIHNIQIDLADSDRSVYESLDLRVARHPSESGEYLVTRVLAYALEYAEGITFTKGVSDPDEPAITIRDLTGALRAWIEIGSPDASRLHKASKGSPRVAVYTHKDPDQFMRNLAGQRIHNADAVEIYAVDRPLVAALAARLDRRMDFALSVNDREITISVGNDTLTGTVRRLTLG